MKTRTDFDSGMSALETGFMVAMVLAFVAMQVGLLALYADIRAKRKELEAKATHAMIQSREENQYLFRRTI